jgi:aspartate 1-decarboxylase
MLKSKVHRATITARDCDYVGSITLDPELMRAADLLVNEQVHVWDIANGARFVTYAIEGEPGSGEVQVNGAAALLVNPGDKVIVASFAAYDERDLERYSPVVVHVDDANAIVRIDSDPSVLLDSPRASRAAVGAGDALGSPSPAGRKHAHEAGFAGVPGSLLPGADR